MRSASRGLTAHPTTSTTDTLDTLDSTTTPSAEVTTDLVTTEGSSSSESSTTGNEPPGCGCPTPNLFCDGFEMFPGPWSMPAGGGGTEMQDNDDAMCGVASARLGVVETNDYAVLAGSIGATAHELFAAPHVLRTFVDVKLECASQGQFARVLDLQYLRGTALIYHWDVAVFGAQVRLTGTNETATAISWFGELPLPEEWVALELSVDFTATPPKASVLIDGEPLVSSGRDAPALVAGEDDGTTSAVILGPFLYGSHFVSDCNVYYDDVSVALLETDP